MESNADKNSSSQTAINNKTLQCNKNSLSFSMRVFFLSDTEGRERKERERERERRREGEREKGERGKERRERNKTTRRERAIRLNLPPTHLVLIGIHQAHIISSMLYNGQYLLQDCLQLLIITICSINCFVFLNVQIFR